jgi:hypothetical protein
MPQLGNNFTGDDLQHVIHRTKWEVNVMEISKRNKWQPLPVQEPVQFDFCFYTALKGVIPEGENTMRKEYLQIDKTKDLKRTR